MNKLDLVSLNWGLFLRANSDRAARQVLSTLSNQLGCAVRITLLERYGRDPALFRAQCTTALEAEEIKTAVYETLVLCNRLGTAWNVTGPSEYEGSSWGLTGYTTKPQSNLHIPEVEMAEFELVVKPQP